MFSKVDRKDKHQTVSNSYYWGVDSDGVGMSNGPATFYSIYVCSV